jgi:hypothetical protein
VRMMISQQKFYYGRARSGIGPNKPLQGWDFRETLPVALVGGTIDTSELTNQDKTQAFNAFIRAWLNKSKQFTPQQYWTGAATSEGSNNGTKDYVPKPAPYPQEGAFPDQIMFMIQESRRQGVDGALLNEVCDWAKTVWPLGNWDSLKG